MEGIDFITDDNSKKKFVKIDLEKYGKLLEDFFDSLAARNAEDDEYIDLKDFSKELRSKGLLNGPISS